MWSLLAKRNTSARRYQHLLARLRQNRVNFSLNWREMAMVSIDEITQEIIRREGGYVNDPDDPGGATNYGVTIGTLKRLGLDVNRDGRVDTRDVRALSQAQAADIFKKQYFEVPKIGMLPEVLQPSVYDMYVNAGGNAIKILQRLLGEFGFNTLADGAIGPNTACMGVIARFVR